MKNKHAWQTSRVTNFDLGVIWRHKRSQSRKTLKLIQHIFSAWQKKLSMDVCLYMNWIEQYLDWCSNSAWMTLLVSTCICLSIVYLFSTFVFVFVYLYSVWKRLVKAWLTALFSTSQVFRSLLWSRCWEPKRGAN